MHIRSSWPTFYFRAKNTWVLNWHIFVLLIICFNSSIQLLSDYRSFTCWKGCLFFFPVVFSFTRVRDLSPSIAIAIAEGNLDPCTMDAFDHFLQPGHQHHPGFQLSDNRHLKEEEDEETTESTQEGCFTILPCHKTIRKRIRGLFLFFTSATTWYTF